MGDGVDQVQECCVLVQDVGEGGALETHVLQGRWNKADIEQNRKTSPVFNLCYSEGEGCVSIHSTRDKTS